MSNVKKLTTASVLLILLIVISRFLSIQTPFLKIGFSFIPIILSAIILGPAWSTIIASVADIIGAFLFPSGPFFIGFTLSAFLSGLTHGLFLHKKDGIFETKALLIRLILSSTITLMFVGGFLNTYWLFLMYNKAFMAIIPIRLVKELIMLPIQIIVSFLLIDKSIRKQLTQYMFRQTKQ